MTAKKSLTEIAEDIIAYSDGSFHIEWGEDYEALDQADQDAVEKMVFEEICNCADCGWYFSYQSMEDINGEAVCWSCYSNREDEEIEE